MSADEFQFHQGAGAFNGSFFGSSVGMVARPGGNGRLFVQELGKARPDQAGDLDRVAEVFAGLPNSAPATGFRLGLRDAAGNESWVDSDEVGGIPRPFPRNAATMKTMLKTLRFRAGCFSADRRLDLTAITGILLHCNRRDERALAFDDLQIVAG